MKDRLINLLKLEIKPPGLKDNTADVDRLIKAIKKEKGEKKVKLDLSLIREIPYRIRKAEYKVYVCFFERDEEIYIIDVYPEEREIYGIAVDLGTSTVVLRIIRIKDMKVIEELSFQNPQIRIGEDILSRIHFAEKEKGLEELQSLIISSLNEKIEYLSKKHEIPLESIVGISVAGNTAMTHFLLGLNTYWLCREPYIPVFNRFEPIKASEIGLKINPRALLFVFPNVGSYFGGDLIAGIIASGITEQRNEIYMLIDIGTNAEVVLGNSDWLVGCAGAAGPALEGGVVNIGMSASSGAIDRIEIDPETLELKYHTIDEKPPVGICGSGLIDLIAHLYLTGMIDIRGKFVPERCGDRLKEEDGIKYFVVVPAEKSGTGSDLTISQPEIDSVIRSKAAMFTILTTLVNSLNISFKDIKKIYIAGTFGFYINPRSAITIGMIPDLPIDTYIPLGNTSIEGATRLFSSRSYFDEMFKIRDSITYIELNVNQEFMQLFSAAKFIPHTDKSLFPSVKQYYKGGRDEGISK